MLYKKHIKITGEYEKENVYYVRGYESSTFQCIMYNVGITEGGVTKEIEDFSPSYEDAVKLCDKLCNEHVSIENIFLVAEEFILL